MPTAPPVGVRLGVVAWFTHGTEGYPHAPIQRACPEIGRQATGQTGHRPQGSARRLWDLPPGGPVGYPGASRADVGTTGPGGIAEKNIPVFKMHNYGGQNPGDLCIYVSQ